jgi:hypothetical protein
MTGINHAGRLHRFDPITANEDVMLVQDESAGINGDVEDVTIADEKIGHGLILMDYRYSHIVIGSGGIFLKPDSLRKYG